MELKIHQYKFDNRNVILIEVPKGDNPPYLLKSRGAMYIRKGANDFQASRSDYDQLKLDNITGIQPPEV